MKIRERKKVYAIILIICITFSTILEGDFKQKIKAAISTVELNLADGDITIEESGYRQVGEFIKFKGQYIIYSENPDIIHKHWIKAVGNSDYHLTIRNLNIDFSGTAAEVKDKVPLEIQNTATVYLTIDGINQFKSGINTAALQVADTASVVIDGKGSLKANCIGNSAAIGGATGHSGGKITINSGTIQVDSKNGAGIGSGSDALSANKIIINGGTIQGEILNGNGLRTGALIGGGNNSSGGDIIINNGIIDSGEVTTFENSYLGAVIGGGNRGNSGNIEIKGGEIFLRSLGAYSKNYSYGKQGVTAKFSGIGDYMVFTVCRTSYYLANTFLAACGANRQGAGIGSGAFGNVESIIIQDGKIQAYSKSYSDSISCTGTIATQDKLFPENTKTFSDNASNTNSLSPIGEDWWCSKGAFIGTGVDGDVGIIKVQGGIIKCSNTFLNTSADYYNDYKEVQDKYEQDSNNIDSINYYSNSNWKDTNGEISIYAQRLVWDESNDAPRAMGKFADLIDAPTLDFDQIMRDKINQCNTIYNQGIFNKAAIIGCGYSANDRQKIESMEITGGTIRSDSGIVGAPCAKAENCNIIRYGGQILNESNDYLPSQITPSAKEQESLYQVAIIIPEIRNRKNVEIISPYSILSQTDENGKLYLWCKEGEQKIVIKTNYKRYEGNIVVTANYNEVALQKSGTCNLSEESINIYQEHYSLNNSQKEIPYHEKYLVTGKTSANSVNILEGIHTIEYGNVESTKTNGLTIKGNSDVTLLFSGRVSLKAPNQNAAIFIEEGSILRIPDTENIFINKIDGRGKILDGEGNQIYLALIQTQYSNQDILVTIDGIEKVKHTNEDGSISEFLSEGAHKIEIRKDSASYSGEINIAEGQANIVFTDTFELVLKIEDGNIDFSSKNIEGLTITTITQNGKSIEHTGKIIVVGNGISSANQITFSEGISKVVLKDMTIHSLLSPIDILVGATADITIEGIVELINEEEVNGKAAIHVPYGANCFITGATLICRGGKKAAAIGGNETETCGNITLKDLEASLQGGEDANDVGNGANFPKEDVAGTIIIEGGKIDLDKINQGTTDEEGNIINKSKIYVNFGADFNADLLRGQEIKVDFTGTKQQWNCIVLDRYLSFSRFISEGIDKVYLSYQNKMYQGSYIVKEEGKGEITNLSLVLPEIITQTKEIVAAYHTSFMLTIAASASLADNTLSYQWFKDGIALENENKNSYSVEKAENYDAGTYYCEITESNGGIIRSADIAVYVGKTKQVIDGPQTYCAKVKDKTITLANTAKTKITYSILDNSDQAFSLEESTGKLIIHKPGSGIILVQAEESDEYYSEEVQIPVVINKNEAPEIYAKDINEEYDRNAKIPEVSVENGLMYSIVYKKQNEPDSSYTSEPPIYTGTYLAKIITDDINSEQATKIIAITINQRPVILPKFIVIPKQYDGTLMAKISVDSESILQNIIQNDDVSVVIPTNNQYADCNVGTNILVTTGAITLTGIDSRNYKILEEIQTLYGTIIPAKLVITANSLEQIIGEEKKELSYTITGLQNGETEEILKKYNFKKPILECKVDTRRVGEYPILISGEILVGNYEITYKNGKYIIKQIENSNNNQNQGVDQNSGEPQNNSNIPSKDIDQNITTEQEKEPSKTEKPKSSDIIGSKENIKINEISSVLNINGNYKGSNNKIKVWYTKTGVLKSKAGYLLSDTNNVQSTWKRKLNTTKNIKAKKILNYCFYVKNKKTGEIKEYFIKKMIIDKRAPIVSISTHISKTKITLIPKVDYGLSGKKAVYYQLIRQGEKAKKTAWKSFVKKKLKIEKDFNGRVYFKHIDNAKNKTITKTAKF